MTWLPIQTAAKRSGVRVLLRFVGGEMSVGYWDAYYAKDGNGFTGGTGWVEPVSGEELDSYYGPPTHWMPLPESPTSGTELAPEPHDA